MFDLKLILVAMLSAFLLNGGGGSGCRAKQNSNSQTQKPVQGPTEKQTSSSGELKVLSEGFHSSINEPFIAVIRDAEPYAALTKLDANLPNLDSSFFDSNALIAAFLGERNTGGYAVEITREGEGGIRLVEKKPGKGMMVPQMITSPFKVVSVERGASSAVTLSIDDAWRRRMRTYRVTSGNFSLGGGFAGKTEKFELEGEVNVMRVDRLVTLAFDIRSSNSLKRRLLVESATGVADSDSQVTLQRFSAGTLVDQPNPGLQATVTFADKEKKLSIQIGSRPSTIADGYIGSGRIEGETSSPKSAP